MTTICDAVSKNMIEHISCSVMDMMSHTTWIYSFFHKLGRKLLDHMKHPPFMDIIFHSHNSYYLFYEVWFEGYILKQHLIILIQGVVLKQYIDGLIRLRVICKVYGTYF